MDLSGPDSEDKLLELFWTNRAGVALAVSALKNNAAINSTLIKL